MVANKKSSISHRLSQSSTIRILHIILITVLLTACSKDTPELAARPAFNAWAVENETPFKDAHFETLDNDGAFATVHIVVDTKQDELSDWVEMEGEIPLRNFGGKWQADIPNNWSLHPTQKWLRDWLGPLAESKFAFLSYDNDSEEGLYVINADGSNMSFISPIKNGNPYWSPDGKKIAVISGETELRYLYVVEVGDRTQVKLAESTRSILSWSPDSSKIAFVSQTESGEGLFGVTITDGRITKLIEKAKLGLDYFAWSPNGSSIAFSSTDDGQQWQIYLIDITSNGVTLLTDGVWPSVGFDWSPDGSKIAFVGTIGGQKGIFVIDVNTKGIIRLTNMTPYSNTQHAPRWSPDGSKIAYVIEYDVYLFEPDGSGVYQLTTNFGADNLTWSPDGSLIVFSTRFDTYVIEPDGTNLMQWWPEHGPSPFSETWLLPSTFR